MNTFTRIKLMLAACAALSFNVVCAQELTDQNKLDAIQLTTKLLEKAQMVPQDVYQKLAIANNTYPSNFSEEQLEKLLKGALSVMVPNTKETQEMRSTLSAMQSALAKKLSSYKVTGFSFAIDPNGAFFVDNQDPEFDVIYNDGRGGVKTKRYKASIDSIGLKIEFSINFDLIFFTGTAANFYDMDKEIELGTGFSTSPWPITMPINYAFKERNPHHNPAAPFSPPFIVPAHIRYPVLILDRFALSYVPFKNMPGGLCIIHAKVGPGLLLEMGAFDASVITGGTLTPLS